MNSIEASGKTPIRTVLNIRADRISGHFIRPMMAHSIEQIRSILFKSIEENSLLLPDLIYIDQYKLYDLHRLHKII